MEINEQETRNYNRTITFVLQNIFSQPVINPFNLNLTNNIEQELIEFTLQQSLQNDEGLEEKEEVEINEPISLFKKDKEDVECSICMETFKNDDRVFVCSCKQTFHYNCINKWIKSKEDCPICRKKINTRVEMDDCFLEWIDNSLDL